MASRDRVDLLRRPLLGRLLRWRWGRLVFQMPLFVVALVVIYDGFTGPRLAPLNMATVLVWIHYRGGVILSLILLANVFCMGCPFALLRSLIPGFAGQGRRWPRRLRNKWGSILLFFLLLWIYEWADLWASPSLTAWLVVGYFGAATATEFAFRESPFCKYLCPLGAFNTLYSTASWLRIGSRNRQICRACANKECVNGNGAVAGCGTELFVPQVASNVDCLLCLDCARACPHDNVALNAIRPGEELTAGVWRRRWDLALLTLILAFSGLMNALGMVPPMYGLASRIGAWLGTANEAVILLLIFGLGTLVLPAGAGLGAAAVSRKLTSVRARLQDLVAVFAPTMVPIGLGVWAGHYMFHFATGALTLIPVTQQFLLDHGIDRLGAPNWQLGPIMPTSWVLPLQVVVVLIGLVGSLGVLGKVSAGFGRRSRPAALPWMLMIVLMAAAAVYLFTLPMEMRGTLELGH